MQDIFAGFESNMRKHFAEMIKDVNILFTVDLDKDALCKLYLDSFPAGTNEIFRTRTENDCSACRHFIKAFGNVVVIKGGKLATIWDFDMPNGSKYGPVAKALSEYIRKLPVTDIFVTDSLHIGVEKNFEKSENGVLTWEHLCIQLPDRFKTASRSTLDTVRGRARDLRNVFKRSLEEISEDAVASVLELIGQNSLYKGEEWKTALEAFQKHQKAYKKLPLADQELYAWEQSILAGPVIGKIRNHSIGALLVDLSKGMELDEAVRRYEAMVAPTNYKRPKAIFTAKMVADAEKTISEMGYMGSLGRRHARLDDITVNNILFANRDAAKQIGGSVFSEMAREVATSPKNFDKVEEIPIAVFLSDVLPTAQNVEVLLENRHQINLVSLIAPTDKSAPSMFKWNNGFSWGYAGNMADSMKQRVKSLGGDVCGVLRFSIQWNDNHDNENDFDAHCVEANGNEIYFRNKRVVHRSSGMLDVDIIRPSSQTKDGIAVENITWSNLSKMPEGTYQMFVHNYSHNGGRSGFTAEVEFDGQIFSFAYNKELRQSEKVPVADVVYSRRDGFKIIEKIPSSLSSKKLWGLDTQQFHPAQVVMYSPNYWDAQDGIGNRHFFFMLKGCQNQESPNGFFNEYLKNDLLEHKRVFEALGSKMRVEPSEEQLSGDGFSSTQRNALVVRVTGHVSRIVKVVF
ncbi:hypothetical protein M0R72_20080 [Candidatus Pacearchaeota archaeon]|jgi:hypothetical protein|nr:hypothetical protein [Candidatus Pacearchaeota archaeon]